jgi:fused signal recognition particle receptor
MFSVFKNGLKKTIDSIKSIVPSTQESIDKDTLEEILLEADVEYEVVEEILEKLPSDIKRDKLHRVLLNIFPIRGEIDESQKPYIELIIGVNGAGKTTTIAKLAQKYKSNGQKVMLGAGDTFRAAAIEQLTIWSQKVGVEIVSTKQGHDPSGVAYDTISSAVAKGYDRVVIDTAGRLHTQTNLGNELKKVVKVCDKALEGAPHRKILILDGTQGNSAIAQAEVFDEMVGIDAIIITKLDGTAKGGSLFSITKKLNKPILYVGVGESADDLVKFVPENFVDELLDSIYTKN